MIKLSKQEIIEKLRYKANNIKEKIEPEIFEQAAEYIEESSKTSIWKRCEPIVMLDEDEVNIPVIQCGNCDMYFGDIMNDYYTTYKYCPYCGCEMVK